MTNAVAEFVAMDKLDTNRAKVVVARLYRAYTTAVSGKHRDALAFAPRFSEVVFSKNPVVALEYVEVLAVLKANLEGANGNFSELELGVCIEAITALINFGLRERWLRENTTTHVVAALAQSNKQHSVPDTRMFTWMAELLEQMIAAKEQS